MQALVPVLLYIGLIIGSQAFRAVPRAHYAAVVLAIILLYTVDGGVKALVWTDTLQTAGMLDSLFAGAAANAKLGVTFDTAGIPTFRLWAPTAKS